MKPLVTVIIPVYNHAVYVKETLDSVYHQTYGYENIQLIVIDDCSTDNSAAVIKACQKQYSFTFIENKTNKGVCFNFSLGIDLAEGKYICGAGSDDYWELNKITRQVAYLEANPQVAVCSGNVTRIDSEGNALPPKAQIVAPERTYGFREVFLRDFPFSTIVAMTRKAVLDQMGGYPEGLKVEDYYMWLKIAHMGYQLHMLPDRLGYYRIHSTNTIHKSWMIYTELRKILAEYTNHPLYPQALRRLKVVYFPQIAQLHRIKALGLLPAAISNTRFFYRGLYYLLTAKKSTYV